MLVAVSEKSLDVFAAHQESRVKSIPGWRIKETQQSRLHPRECHKDTTVFLIDRTSFERLI